ncbi:hypothetical protein POVCU1_052520 [Plasmodium ovale curtisi]|uniref:Uncharacterized protein n=1 Tax=Plasmodium ovale curtisi TaxID=864141 RepID=A0A1A8X6K1_PLAOA|nr:hypothetical protein POVCU1_052520 [Plasmodium ovale curtisi]
MNAIIKSANGFYKDIWDTLIKKVEQKWEQFPEVNYKDKLYIKIENDTISIIGPQSHILNSSNYICDVELDELSDDDITIPTDMESLIMTISLEKISPNKIKKA